MIIDPPFKLKTTWKVMPLGEACESGGGDIQTGPFGSQLHKSDYVSSGIPSIMPANITEDIVSTDGIARITSKDAQRLNRYLVREGDIVYSRRGDVERRAYIGPKEDGWLCGTGCLRVRPGSNGLLSKYVFYYLGHPDVKAWIVRHAIGATMANLNTKILSSLPISVPSLREQQAIAHILGAFDDKIDLNRRMNQTLESMARAIFKSWFVDFDDCAEFQDSELGKIPKGWKMKPIREVVKALFDGPHATPKKAESGAVFLGIKNLTGTGLDLNTIRWIAEKDWPRWTKRVTPQAGDIVFTYEATLGYFAIVPPGLRCCLGRRLALVRPRLDLNNRHFIFHTFIGPAFQQLLDERKNPGATVDRILLKDFPSYPIVYPSSDMLGKFESYATSVWDKIHTASAENATLTKLRDTLLPKLISGELRVPDAEKMAGEVL